MLYYVFSISISIGIGIRVSCGCHKGIRRYSENHFTYELFQIMYDNVIGLKLYSISNLDKNFYH
ncbi:hypothetical protein SPRA44_330034 [Serratia proteamaculans]|nr:hypothetical protein SPRA44_330034 [Serratia proteamaculans]